MPGIAIPVGLWALVVNPPGPLHEYPTLVADELPSKLTEGVVQLIVPLLDAVAVGGEFTIMVILVVPVPQDPLEPVSV